eukprot:CAMPEP_0116872854 /NCGR_PEP_ID=MMETSP0463-20121206/3765_1 /TAXON_ID=181622 /ORGANISM="Strombidinopsis sp, Strain SopsisLIS2011" /LENGTH=67 /DNA_ID=CAMNT_0004513813 /DNA_START=2316 /DNA_END=2519 /DNA_ORIENTATION=-
MTTIITLKIELTDSIRAATIIFKATLCEINLRGRRVRRSLKTLIAGISTAPALNISIIEDTTMKQSS